MRYLAIGMMVMAFGACAQPSGGKASTDELGNAVVGALKAKDESALFALGANVEQRVGACPALGDKQKVAEARTKAEELLASELANCQKIDWSKAAIVTAKGGGKKEPVAGCPDFVTLKDVNLTVDVGGQHVNVRLDNPISLGGQIFLEGMRCSGGAASPPAIAATLAAADKVCACTTMDCANDAAAALAKFMKDQPLDGASPDDSRLVGKATRTMHECLTKLQANAPAATPKPEPKVINGKPRLSRDALVKPDAQK